MWKVAYSLLLVARLYFALSPAYIHPDEHFQGPEVVAGELLNWHSQRTWEFTSDQPIRSYFPLWLAYGLPIKVVEWIFASPTPEIVFNSLRITFLALSIVLEDWAFFKLVPNSSPSRKGWRLALLASSYVTWTFQTHTFSNSIETILVLWALVLMDRIRKAEGAAWVSSGVLGFLCVLGTFNRITFPAFLLFPALRLLPDLWKRPSTLAPLILTAGVTAAYAVHLDTEFYQQGNPVITPLNNLLYNTQTSNLAKHGLHPRVTHVLVNLPQLIGPALLPFASTLSRHTLNSLPVLSALSGLAFLSILPHQEARFLIPCVPLILTEVTLPRFKRSWLASWILFNLGLGVLMGVYHQGGIVPAQIYLSTRTNATDIVYWKTYMPPNWLLGSASRSLKIIDVPSPLDELVDALQSQMVECSKAPKEVYLVAPLSAVALDPLVDDPRQSWKLERIWVTRQHLNLDDLDFGEDGVMATVRRVLGRRGLGIWKVDGRS